MIKLEFTEKEIEQLHHERLHHPHHRVRQKMEVVYLKALNYPHKEICRITRIAPNTLISYLREYEVGGIEALKAIQFNCPVSDLEEHKERIKEAFEKHPPSTLKEARQRIKELTGIERSLQQIGVFLKKSGFRKLKVAQIPAKADVEKQKKFVDEELEPRIEEAKAGKRSLFFVDAAHFVLRPVLGFLWCLARIFIKAPAGRQRYNVLGALNATTRQVEIVTNDSYINALSVIDLLEQIAEKYKETPITLVMDNARYQRCKVVMKRAEQLGIELLFLPSYSPNLNLIERLWKFVKKTCLYSEYYENFKAFKKGINDCLEQLGSTYKEELESLLTLKFQTFENVNLCP